MPDAKPIRGKKIIYGIIVYVVLLVSFHLWRPETDIKMTEARTNVDLGVLSLEHFRLDNGAYIDLKDSNVTCDMNGPSDTTIKKVSKVLYEVLPAGSWRVFGPIEMGEVPEQATKFKCYVSSASVKW